MRFPATHFARPCRRAVARRTTCAGVRVSNTLAIAAHRPRPKRSTPARNAACSSCVHAIGLARLPAARVGGKVSVGWVPQGQRGNLCACRSSQGARRRCYVARISTRGDPWAQFAGQGRTSAAARVLSGAASFTPACEARRGRTRCGDLATVCHVAEGHLAGVGCTSAVRHMSVRKG